MPRRSKMSPVEFLVLMAIVGILISIILPTLSRARRSALEARRRPVQAAAEDSRAVDGQLNTIEVSEVAQNAPDSSPERFITPFVRLVPLAAVVFFIVFVLSRLRRQMPGRPEL